MTPDGDHAAMLYRKRKRYGWPRPASLEISNHAAPGAELQHNLVYWRYGEYVGVGPGAHGRFVENGTRAVTITERHPETWVKKVEAGGHGVVEEEFLNGEQEGDEFLLMGLRLVEGIDLARYERLTGHSIKEGVISLAEQGLIEYIGNSRIRTTPEGAIVLNAVIADLAA